MELAGQGNGRPTRPARVKFDDGGYVLAVLLMSMAVAAVWMAAALPAWRHQAQREREEEGIFRGEQYARAIALFYIKNNCQLPQDVDMLVSGHYLRKKWKDPIDNDDFNLIGGSSTSGQPIQAGVGSSFQQPAQPPQGQSQQVGISGVSPKSTATSIKLYNNQQQYSLWMFTYASALQKMGQSCQRGGPNNGRNGPPGATGGRQGPAGPGGQPVRGGPPGTQGGGSGPGGPGLTPRQGAGGPGGGSAPPASGGPARPGGAGS